MSFNDGHGKEDVSCELLLGKLRDTMQVQMSTSFVVSRRINIETAER